MATKRIQPSDSQISWIDFDAIKVALTKPPILSAEKLLEEIKFYFHTNKKYNIYGLAAHLLMGKERFMNQYVNSVDEPTKHVTAWALSVMTSHAMNNEEEYKRTLRYIISQAETGKAFIELSNEVLDSTANKIIILPAKD